MNDSKSRVVCVGEAMIELARGADGRFGLSCCGDTFNTAVYLPRSGTTVAFATALGDDPYSDAILARTPAEAIAADLVLRLPRPLPALRMVQPTPPPPHPLPSSP